MDPQIRSIALDSERVIEATSTLGKRIAERFPNSELALLAQDLVKVAEDAKERTALISKPIYWVRIVIAVLLILLVGGVLGTVASVHIPAEGIHIFELIQVLEAGLNDVVLLGAGIFFLVSIETRLKRRRALKALHELRSIAHSVDMLQLTKDPSKIIFAGESTASSPTDSLSGFLLSRYLDYCSEMLSLVGKIAALYVEHFEDAVAIGAVNEVELITTGLSRKIWQKIIILHSEAKASQLKM